MMRYAGLGPLGLPESAVVPPIKAGKQLLKSIFFKWKKSMTKLHQHPMLCAGNLLNDLNFQNLQENDLLYSQFLEKIGKNRTSVPRIERVDGKQYILISNTSNNNIPWRYLNPHDKLPKLHDNINFFVRHRRAKRKADSDSLDQNPNIITPQQKAKNHD